MSAVVTYRRVPHAAHYNGQPEEDARMENRWNQAKRGNAHVSDGQEGFWAEFPAGTSAQVVLDEYMSTADYPEATAAFTVTAEIEGRMASARIGPGGEVH